MKKQKLYLIVDTKSKCTKIGIAKHPETRLRQLRTGNPNLELYKVYSFSNARKKEKELHRKFRNKRVGGEFFKVSPSTIDNYIRGKSKKIITVFYTLVLLGLLLAFFYILLS